ncbi:MAG: AMP-binding protein [Candidatus Hydrogenedentes bacterium]|nr:AMP-binding protein [Candidatus Hydrogenedentota bacterium]
MKFEDIESLFQFNKNSEFIRTERGFVPYSELLMSIHRLSKKLSSFEGKIVGIVAPVNGLCLVDFICLLLSLLKLNAKVLILSPKEPPLKIKERVQSIRCNHILFFPDKINHVEELKSIFQRKNHYFSSNFNGPDSPDLDSLWIGEVETKESNLSLPDEPWIIISTSGSGGKPKNVVLTLDNLFTNARFSNRNIKFQGSDTWFLSLPVFHVSGLSIIFRAIESGSRVFLSHYGLDLCSDWLPEDITHVSLVSTLLWRILKSNSPKIYDRFRKLKAILLGGGPIPQAIVKKSYNLGWHLYTTYGMTEMASQITTTVENDTLEHLFTSGKPLIPDTVKLGAEGEISVRGPTRFIGYLDEGQLKTPFDKDGWFETGDVGKWTDDGYLCISGRKDSMFVCGGENIFPEEIETCILESGIVNKAIVIPQPDDEYGMIPIAYVEFVNNSTEERLISYLRTRLSGIRIPRKIYPLPEGFKNSGMKLSRNELIEYVNRQKDK